MGVQDHVAGGSTAAAPVRTVRGRLYTPSRTRENDMTAPAPAATAATATTPTAPPGEADAAAPLRLTGIQHIGLTVADVEASAAWYQRVLGLERQFDEPHRGSDVGGYAVVLGTPDMSLNVGLDHHPAHGAEPFDPARTGLDHICFHVGGTDDLDAWADHLDRLGIAHSGAYAMDGMPVSLLTFRDPDGIALELIAFHGAPPAAPPGRVPPEVMDDVLARHFAAEAVQDRPGILATLTEDAEHEPIGFPGAPFHGHTELIGFYDALFGVLEQVAVTPIRRLHGADFLVDEVQYAGRAFGDFMGLDLGADGMPVDFRLLHVCEFTGDRIRREQVWLDVNAIRAQTSPPAGATEATE
jgi:catechol 2,3-dioxygenase-like lactoylglutathione lyase family enzyme